MIKKIICLILIAAMLLLFSSCGKSDGTNASFVFPIASEPASLDPQLCADSATATAVTNIYEGLVRIGENGNIVHGVARDMDISSNGLVYTFYLREDTKWHLINNFDEILGDDFEDSFDNSVTAYDFVYGFRRALSPETGAPNVESLYSVTNAKAVLNGEAAPSTLGVTALDKYTLRITLSSPCNDFLTLLTQPICMPCNEKFFNATKGKYGLDLQYTLCNGPFYLSKWNVDSSLYLRKNGDYTGSKEVLPYSVSLYFNNSTDKFAQKVLDGVYDAAPVTVDTLTLFSEGFTVSEFKNSVCGLFFNCSDPLLSSLNLRLALCSAFDSSLIDLPSGYQRTGGLLPECCLAGGKNYRELAGNADFVDYNPEHAKILWDSALIELDVSSVTLTVLCTSSYESSIRQMLQFWQQTFGISAKISVETTEPDKLISKVENGNYQIALYPMEFSHSSASFCLSDFTSEAEKNIFNFKSEAFDSIVAKIYSAPTAASTAEGCRTAESYLMQNGVVFPMSGESSYFAVNENVSGIYTCPAGEAACFISAIKFE